MSRNTNWYNSRKDIPADLKDPLLPWASAATDSLPGHGDDAHYVAMVQELEARAHG